MLVTVGECAYGSGSSWDTLKGGGSKMIYINILVLMEIAIRDLRCLSMGADGDTLSTGLLHRYKGR